MYYDIDQRVINEADYVIREGATVRKTAETFGVGKSTVHYDMTKRLPYLDEVRAELVRKVLNINLSERHIRGGMSTRRKYLDKSLRK